MRVIDTNNGIATVQLNIVDCAVIGAAMGDFSPTGSMAPTYDLTVTISSLMDALTVLLAGQAGLPPETGAKLNFEWAKQQFAQCLEVYEIQDPADSPGQDHGEA